MSGVCHRYVVRKKKAGRLSSRRSVSDWGHPESEIVRTPAILTGASSKGFYQDPLTIRVGPCGLQFNLRFNLIELRNVLTALRLNESLCRTITLKFHLWDGGNQPVGASAPFSSGLTGSACSMPSRSGAMSPRMKVSGGTGIPTSRLSITR